MTWRGFMLREPRVAGAVESRHTQLRARQCWLERL